MKKNTVSLLEAIKKKISKIDGKEEDPAAQNLDEEFEYFEKETESEDESASAQENQNVSEVSDINLESSIEASIGDEERGAEPEDQANTVKGDTEGFDLSFDDQDDDNEVDFGDLDSVMDEKEAENKEEVSNQETQDLQAANEEVADQEVSAAQVADENIAEESSPVQEQGRGQDDQQATTDNQQETPVKNQEQEPEEAIAHSAQQHDSNDQQQNQDDFELGFEEVSQQDPEEQNSAFLRQDEELQEAESEVEAQTTETEKVPQEDLAATEAAQEESDPQSDTPDEVHEDQQDSFDQQDKNVEVSDQVLDDSHFEEDHDSESGLDNEDFDAQDQEDDQQDDFEIDEDEEFAIDDIADDDSDTPRFTAQTLASVPSQAEENVDINDEEDEEDEDINFDDLEDDLHFDEDEDGDFANDADGHGLHEDSQGQALGQVKENTHEQTASEVDFKASSQDLNSQMEEFLNSDTPPGFYENINQEQPSSDQEKHLPQESQSPAQAEDVSLTHQHSRHQPAPDQHFADDHNNNQYQFQTRYFAKDRDQKYKTLKQLESDITINSRIADKVSQTIQNISDTKKMIKEADGFVGGGMLSHVAFELMKPKLEKWLEANLPDLVENVVRQEIKKIISQENE